MLHSDLLEISKFLKMVDGYVLAAGTHVILQEHGVYMRGLIFFTMFIAKIKGVPWS